MTTSVQLPYTKEVMICDDFAFLKNYRQIVHTYKTSLQKSTSIILTTSPLFVN